MPQPENTIKNANPEYMVGIAEVYFNKKKLGYIEKDSFDLGGKKGEFFEIEAEQVPTDPVASIPISNPSINPKFNLIQLKYETFQDVIGGELVKEGPESQKVVGWNSPVDLVLIEGPFTLKFRTGRVLEIKRARMSADLGGKVSLKSTSKLECELKTLAPEESVSSYSLLDKASEIA